MQIEPATCTNMITATQKYCWRINKSTVSAEKVEKVVKPPRKPVTMNNWMWADNPGCRAIQTIIKPIKYPPIKLANTVPSGSFKKSGLNHSEKNHLSQAPKLAPAPIAKRG